MPPSAVEALGINLGVRTTLRQTRLSHARRTREFVHLTNSEIRDCSTPGRHHDKSITTVDMAPQDTKKAGMYCVIGEDHPDARSDIAIYAALGQ